MPRIPLELCRSQGDVTDPVVRPGGEWVSGVQSSDGDGSARIVLRMWSVHDGRCVDLLEEPVPLTGRGSSGGVHCWNDRGDRVYVCTRDSGVAEVRLVGDEVHEVRPTAFDASRSWSTPSWVADGRVLWAVADWCELWSVAIDGGDPVLVHRADDGFVVDADGPGGRAHSWTRPDMPWTTSHLSGDPRREAVSVQQPRSTRDGRFRGHIEDSSGFANVVIESGEGGHVGAIDDECEHAGPTWGPGQRTWCFSPDGAMVAYTRNEQGHGSLWLFDRMSGARTRIGLGVHGCLSWEGNTLAAHRTGARTPPEIVVHDMTQWHGTQTGPGDGTETRTRAARRTRLVTPADPRWYHESVRQEMVEPSLHTAPAHDGGLVPFRLFRAGSAHGGVIVWVHGGPIDQWQVAFRPRHLYWLSRGWSIAVLDHRGTTGWGRTFALDLEGNWGDLDARDVVSTVVHLHREHGFSPERTVLMGSSAGGLSVLNALRHAPDVAGGAIAGGAVLAYPVVDLAAILVGQDPFETHYMSRLIGTADPASSLVADRSPHLHGGSLVSVPLLIFHGDADAAVPLAHSLALSDAVTRAGGTCELVVFGGEGHGFKQPATIETEFTRTEEFLSRLL